MNWHAEVQTVFLLIWGITMLLWPLYHHIQNVALVHSCLEIPILKFLRCRSSSEMKRHIFLKNSTSYTGLLSVALNMVNWGLRYLWSFLKGLTESAIRATEATYTICAGCISWHVWIKTFHVFWYPAMTLSSYLITFCSLQYMMEMQYAALSVKT